MLRISGCDDLLNTGSLQKLACNIRIMKLPHEPRLEAKSDANELNEGIMELDNAIEGFKKDQQSATEVFELC